LDESDVTIFLSYYAFGNLPRVKRRLANNKLCLSFGERRWKPSHPFCKIEKLKDIPSQLVRVIRILKHAWPLNHKQHHLLAIGIYAARDEQKIGMFKDRMWSWAYFVPVSREIRPARKNDTIRILWAGRMIDWKRVDTLIKALSKLNERNITNYHVDLIGDGPEKDALFQLVRTRNLESNVDFHPFMQPDEIRREMSQSDIFVWPSDSEEGWGVVINEAMAEGCAVVACKEAGAAPVLIDDGSNGFLFPLDDSQRLAEILEKLIADPDYTARIGRAAKEHIEAHWSPDVAAGRIVEFSRNLLQGKAVPDYASGPLSSAIIKHPGS
jgi:glycosyltransferase involved in cell wall biosynthesis